MAANCGPMFFKSQITVRSEVTARLEVENSFKNNSLKLGVWSLYRQQSIWVLNFPSSSNNDVKSSPFP